MQNLHEFDLKLTEEQKMKCCVKNWSETVVIRPFKSHSKLELCFYTKKKYWVCAKLHVMQVGCNTFVSHCNYWNQFPWGTSTPAMQSNGPLPQVNKGDSTQSHHVTCLLVQICNAELTAGHSELKYWVYFLTFCDVNFYT